MCLGPLNAFMIASLQGLTGVVFGYSLACRKGPPDGQMGNLEGNHQPAGIFVEFGFYAQSVE